MTLLGLHRVARSPRPDRDLHLIKLGIREIWEERKRNFLELETFKCDSKKSISCYI